MKCRFCGQSLNHVFVDLGTAPPSNSFLSEDQLNKPELFLPLKVLVCESCFLVQTGEYVKPGELFSDDYVYFSSTSRTWLKHCQTYANSIIPRLGLSASSFVVEIASNDGYLLQFFKERRVPCLGIEPTRSTAEVARSKGIEVTEEFFGLALAQELAANGQQADLIICNNVLAHVPDLNDFVAGLNVLLKPTGTITLEFPHLLHLIQDALFDTIYHEHFSYLSLLVVDRVFRAHGLAVCDVEELGTHGGSLRVYASHTASNIKPFQSVGRVLALEKQYGLDDINRYQNFQARVDRVKDDFVSFLIDAKRHAKGIAAYGAAAKGNTLINYAGIRRDLIEYVVDRAESKQGRYLPGSRIPVVGEDRLSRSKPEYIIIFPWNLKQEIEEQLSYARFWNASFVTAIPGLDIF